MFGIHKKADLNVSFSWIFIIIVGSLLLMVSWNVVQSYKKNKDAEFRVELEFTLESIFNKFARSTGTEDNSISLIRGLFKDNPITIRCVSNVSVLDIGGDLTTNNNYLKSYPTFMSYIDNGGNEVYIGSENFRFPFKVVNLMFLVSKKNLIVFDKSSNIGKLLYNKFKSTSYFNLNFILIDFSDLGGFNDHYVNGYNLDSVTFVTDEGGSFDSSVLSYVEVPVYIVKIKSLSDFRGVVYFYNLSSMINSFNYFDMDGDLVIPTVAVFSAPDVFECGYNKLIKNILYIYDFYIRKVKVYEDYDSLICEKIYSIEEQRFKYKLIEDLLVEIRDELKDNGFKNGEVLEEKLRQLDFLNRELGRVSCPYIY